MYVLGILVDKSGKTIGARIQDQQNIVDVTTEQLKNTDIEFENAIVDVNGYVRSKSGTLNKIVINTRPNAIEQSEILSVNKIQKQSVIQIYHGNKDCNMQPAYGLGGADNDYGKGFYTTPNKELAKEWAWGAYTSGNKAYVHSFELDTSSLNILNLSKMDSLHWIAELLCNRKINIDGKEVVADNIERFIDKYKLDTSKYDVIIGYRADDSYFTFAEAFVSGTIYKDTLEKALRTGELGIQVFLKSKKAFENLKKIEVEEVPVKYRAFFTKRDKNARDMYKTLRQNQGVQLDRRTIHNFI